jgi:hypothetical protein
MGTSLERTSPRRWNGVNDTTVTYYGRSDVHDDAFKQDGGLGLGFTTTRSPSCVLPDGFAAAFDVKGCLKGSNGEEMCVFTCQPGYKMMNKLTNGFENSTTTTFTCKNGILDNNFSCVPFNLDLNLCSPNEDFGRRNKRCVPDFRMDFQWLVAQIEYSRP